MPRQSWTSQLDDILRKMAADGKTSTQIAKVIGRGRPAVCGRCNRLGIKLGLKEERRNKIVIKRGAVKKTVFVNPYQPREKIRPSAGIALIDAGSHQCRWVIGNGNPADYRFCGAYSGDSSYCPEHHGIVYMKVRPRVVC